MKRITSLIFTLLFLLSACLPCLSSCTQAENSSESNGENESMTYDFESLTQNAPEVATDIFRNYMPDAADEPEYEVLSSETVTASGEGCDVILSRLLVDLMDNGVYTIVAHPVEEGIYPAVIFIHGAGGTADDYRNTVIAAAREGFIAVSYEQPSIASTDCTSTGAWKTDGSYKYDFNGDPYEAPMYAAVAAGLTVFKGLYENSFILDARGYYSDGVCVDTDKIGINGISYGGYMTTFLTALLGDYVDTAVAKFITGNYFESEYFWGRMGQYIADEDMRTLFCRYFDPLYYADGVTAKFFTVGAGNDTFGSLPTLISFHNAMTKAERRDFCLAPNANHNLSTLTNGGCAFGNNGVSMLEWNYLVFGLTGEGTPPTLVTEEIGRAHV